MTPKLTPRAAVAAILAAGFAAMLALNLPGQLSFDSIEQLHDGRFGDYHSWHPPVMAWLLGLGDAAMRGTALFVSVNAALFFGALVSLLWLRPRVSRAAAVVAGVLVLLPQLLLYEGIVWKDVLFANAGVAGFVLLAHGAANWRRRGRRFACLVASFALLTLSAMARQNGIAMLLAIGAVALGVLAARDGIGKAVLYGAVAFALSVALGVAGNFALALHGDRGVGAREEIKLLEVYDLVGALTRAPGLRLNALARDDPRFAALLRGDGVRLYSPARNDTLEQGSPALWNALGVTPPAALFADWRALAFGRPALYLRTRMELFRWVFLTPDLTECLPIYVGIDSQPPDDLHDLGLEARERPQDNWLRRYATHFVGTPVFSHAAFAAGALFALVLLLRRRTPADLALGFMLLAAFGFTASFFFVSIACDYRYLYFLDLSALAALFYLVLDFRRGGSLLARNATK